MATAQSHIEIRLFSLRRQAGGRPPTLGIYDDQWQFRGCRQGNAFGLERDAGAGTGSHTQRAGKGSTDSRTHRCNLVFRLEGIDTKFFSVNQFVQQIRCRCNWISSKQHFDVRQL